MGKELELSDLIGLLYKLQGQLLIHEKIEGLTDEELKILDRQAIFWRGILTGISNQSLFIK